MTLRSFAGLGALLSLLFVPGLAVAQEATLDSGDTAWMLTATALVLFMTIPGLALFYGGMVRSKNILSVMMQCFAITGLISILWMIYGYSLAFDTSGMEAGVTNFNSFVGGLERAFLAGLTTDSLVGAFPESVFVTFQMTFAIITPALIVGAFAERMKFSAMLVFMALWFTFVYAPIAHMVWSGDGGLMWDWGVLDFAGGTVVHINAGVAGLIACLVIGKRKGYPNVAMRRTTWATPWSRRHAVDRLVRLQRRLGGGGQRHRRHGNAGDADRHRGCRAGLDVRRVGDPRQTERPGHRLGRGRRSGRHHAGRRHRRTGRALVIGLVSGVVCFFCATSLKRRLGYDDSLDAFGVHGIGGIVGALLTGVFAAPSLGGFGEVENIAAQFFIQFKGVLFTVVYTAVVTFVILKVLDLVMGLRVGEEQETIGLDLSAHNERGYNL